LQNYSFLVNIFEFPVEIIVIYRRIYRLIVNSYGVRLARNLAFIKRNYEKFSNKKLSDSSWYERFTPELVAFLKLCVTHGIEQLANEQTKVLNEKIAKFQD